MAAAAAHIADLVQGGAALNIEASSATQQFLRAVGEELRRRDAVRR